MFLRSIFCLLALFCLASPSFAQQKGKLKIVNGDLVVKNPDKPNESVWLYKNARGQAEMIQKQTTIESDSTKFFESRNYAEAKGNVFINQGDSIDIYSNEAFYYGNTRKAILSGEVALLKDIYTLQTEKLNYDLDRKIATYTTGGELQDTTSTLTSIKGTYYVDRDEAVFQDSVVLVSPERRIETEKLTYKMNEKWAFFEGETTIYEDGQTIKTKKGKYNTETGEALIEGDPKIDNEDTYAKADQFVLTEKNGIGKAVGNVYYKDKKNNTEMTADEVEQLNEDEIFAKGNLDVLNLKDSIKLKADQALINQTTEVTIAEGNVDITNLKDSINLKAERTEFNQKAEEYFATDNVVLTVLNQDTQLLTDTLEMYQKQGFGKAYGRPFLSSFNEGDSVYLVAKEMQALQKVGEAQDTVYDFMANRHVMLYKSDLQAVADSAYVNNRDSVITLFHNPVVWSDSTQMTADTIRIFMKKKAIDRVEFRKNCFFINLVDTGLYNQLKGKLMDAYFVDGKIDSLHTNGNAETIFMVQDDLGAYVAIDKMQSGKMDVSFLEGKMDQIYWYNQQSGTTYPFQDVNPTDYRLPGFLWREEEKPRSKDDLLIAIGRMEGDFKFIERERNVNTNSFSFPTSNDGKSPNKNPKPKGNLNKKGKGRGGALKGLKSE